MKCAVLDVADMSPEKIRKNPLELMEFIGNIQPTKVECEHRHTHTNIIVFNTYYV